MGLLPPGGGGDAEAAEVEATPTPSELGPLVELDSVTLNLEGGSFLKVGLAVELSAGAAEELPTAPMYDQMIALFGRMTLDELSVAETRNAAKDDLLAAFADTYGEDIVRLYFTEFVMQ